MDIKQILRDAIDNKVAKILKEEYGIEPSEQMMDETSNEVLCNNLTSKDEKSKSENDEPKKKARRCVRHKYMKFKSQNYYVSNNKST